MTRKSILFIADKPNWAYHNIVKTWVEALIEYDCYIAFSQDYAIRSHQFSTVESNFWNFINALRSPSKYFKIDSSKGFSIPKYKNPPVYMVSTMQLVEQMFFDYQVELAYYFQYTSIFPFKAKTKIVGLYTDSFPHEGPYIDKINDRNLHHLDRDVFFKYYLSPYEGIIVGNNNLLEDYRKYTDKIVCANGIYKQDEFKNNPTVGKHKHLTIGWTGTPDRPMKGFREFIVPAVEQLQSEGLNIRLKTKFSGPYDELLTFYTDVDLVLIASEADTGPSLFAEASLSGVPSISTSIGFPKMVIEDGINGVIVERNITCFKKAIRKLYEDRQTLIAYSNRIKEDYLKALDNQRSVKNLKEFLIKTAI